MWTLTTGLAALYLARALNGVLLAVLVATAVAAGGAGLIRLARDIAIAHGHNTGDGSIPGSKSWLAVALLGSWWFVSFFDQGLLPYSEWDGASAHQRWSPKFGQSCKVEKRLSEEETPG